MGEMGCLFMADRSRGIHFRHQVLHGSHRHVISVAVLSVANMFRLPTRFLNGD